LKENNKNINIELLSMLEDLLVEGVVMEVLEVVVEEEEVEDKEIMIMMNLRKNTKKKMMRLNNLQTMVVIAEAIRNVISPMKKGWQVEIHHSQV
jgi:transcription initiation factor IIE alpha subunit